MSEKGSEFGKIGWIDLTVPDAVQVRDFYSKVVGWSSSSVSMGDYDDFCMIPKGSEVPSAGVCHARGKNAEIPAQWIIYITVEDLDNSLEACTSNGGELVSGPREMGDGSRYCVIKDPAGAVAALFQKG